MRTMNIPRRPLVPVGLRGLGHWLPSRCLTNEDLVRRGCPVSVEWIEQKTGIRTRYVAEDSEALSDLVIPAAQLALAFAGLSPGYLDALVVGADMHDSGGVQLTSALVAQALGLSGITCIDLRAGCPASVMALHLGASFVGSGLANRILVAAGEIQKDMDYADRTSVWFGDGAGAAVLERCAPETGILATFMAGTGEGSEILTVPAGGSREPLTAERLAAGRYQLQMDGRAVFSFAVKAMVESLLTVTDSLGIQPSQLDWIVPHQANLRIIEAAMVQLNLPMDRAYVNLDKVGNTAGASVLLALSEAYGNGIIRPGDLVATVGFGGGLAWGAQVIRINHPKDFEEENRNGNF